MLRSSTDQIVRARSWVFGSKTQPARSPGKDLRNWADRWAGKVRPVYSPAGGNEGDNVRDIYTRTPSVCGGHNSLARTTVHHHQPRVRAHARVSVCRPLAVVACCLPPARLRCVALLPAVASRCRRRRLLPCFACLSLSGRLVREAAAAAGIAVAHRRARAGGLIERDLELGKYKGTSQTGNRTRWQESSKNSIQVVTGPVRVC